MKIFKYFFLVFTIGTLYASSPPLHKNQILYLTGTGQYKKAIAYYQKITKESKISDFETLQQMALILLENGAKSKNAEEERLAIFGSGLAGCVFFFFLGPAALPEDFNCFGPLNWPANSAIWRRSNVWRR